MEFLYTPHQAVRLAGDWWMHLPSPMLQGPYIGDVMLQLGEMDVLGTEPYVLVWQEMVLSNGGVCWQLYMVVVHLLCPVACLRNLKVFIFAPRYVQFQYPVLCSPSGQILCGLHGWGSL